MTVLRNAYVKVRPDTSKFDTELKDRLAKVEVGPQGERLGSKFVAGFTKRMTANLKGLDLPAIDLKANPREAIAAIDKTERELRELSRTAKSLEIRLNAESALGDLTRFRKRLGDVGDDSGKSWFARFSQRVGPLVASMPLSPPMLIAIGSAAAAAAPVLAAAVSGAVTLGVTGGVLAAGLKIAAKDPEVQEAGKIAGAEFSQGLAEATAPFKGEIISALGVARTEFRRLRPEIDGLFADASRFVPVLADALARMGREAIPGIRQAVAEAKPLVDVLADHGPKAAALFSQSLATLAGNSREAAAGIDALLKVIELLVGGSVASLGLLTKIMPAVTGGFLYLVDLLPDVKTQSDGAAAGSKELADQLAEQARQALANAAALEQTKAGTAALQVAQKGLSDSQQGLNNLLESFSPAGGRATQVVNAMRQATDNLYGSTIAAAEANEGYQSSWDGLSGAVKANGRSLDIHTAAGRSNRDALQDVIGRTNDLYFAEIAAGASIASATKKHNDRIAAIKEEAKRLGLNRVETQKLINTYGQIPPKKATQLILEGLNAIADALSNVYIAQRALAEGKTVDQVRGGYQGSARLFKAAGGPIFGPGTGTSDSVPIMASAGEHMWTAREVDAAGGHERMHRLRRAALAGELKGYAAGGTIAPVDTSRRWPFRVDVADSFVMSKAAALAKVTPPFPRQGSPTLDFMVKAIRQAFPGLALISGYRPGARTLSGNVSYHALHRAVDYPPNWDLAQWVNQHYKARTKEFISPFQDMNILNGARHTYTGAVWNQHNFAGGNAHDHWAMAGGGIIREPILGVGRSGRTYSFGERGDETVIPGVGAGEVHFHFHGPVASRKATQDMVLEAYNALVAARKIPAVKR